MVDTGAIGSIGSALITKLTTGTIVIIGVIILCAVLFGIGFYVKYLSQFIYDIEIKSLRSSGAGNQGSSYKIIKDKGAFIRNKRDKKTWFRLRNQRVDLPIPPLECMQIGVKGKNFIKILQKSDEEYYYLLPDKIETTMIIKDGIEIMLGQETAKIVDGDVAYWNIQRKKDNKKLFDPESMIMKLLPYIIPALMIIGVVFYTYIWLDKAPAIIEAGRQVAEALDRAAEHLASITTIT